MVGLPAGAEPSAIVAGNFDGDANGRPDLAIASYSDGKVYVHMIHEWEKTTVAVRRRRVSGRSKRNSPS